jgi:hypothetical protein
LMSKQVEGVAVDEGVAVQTKAFVAGQVGGAAVDEGVWPSK